MADATKHLPINGGTLISDIKCILSLRTKKTRTFAYGFIFAFILFTVFLAFFNPSSANNNPSSPWFSNIFSTTNTTSLLPDGSLRSHFNSIYNYFFQPNSSSPLQITNNSTFSLSPLLSNSTTSTSGSQNGTYLQPKVEKKPIISDNQTQTNDVLDKVGVLKTNQTSIVSNQTTIEEGVLVKNYTESADKKGALVNQTVNSTSSPPPIAGKNSSEITEKGILVKNVTEIADKNGVLVNQTVNSIPKPFSPPPLSVKNSTEIVEKGNLVKNVTSSSSLVEEKKQGSQDLVKGLLECNLFDGEWVKDDSYPLYKPGSCSLIDEQFGCLENGRPDKGFQHMKWKPYGCTLPRLDGSNMLRLLKGKRIVFVGDSLNRNMWESLICILRSSVKDLSKVYEASGRHHFRSEASYSFIFKDYDFTVEFFVSPFLVRESETKDKNGKKKETLRLDLLGTSADHYKNADIIIFNTGHWWTHDKTAKGKDYYQEGSHVYGELNVQEAFRKAITTWGRWIDANVNPMKTTVFFRGYSASHFSGGQWNSGGQCDHEIEPIKNKTYLRPYPEKMMVLEKVIKHMKTPISYLNITSLTDYRKDGHPSLYRKRHADEKEKIPQMHFQDCSHWCLPGVPDAWNELLYAELLIKQYQKQHQS